MNLRGREIILASASARRIELLEGIGLRFKIKPADIDERIVDGELPAEAAVRLACLKASAIAKSHPRSVILAADTLVAVTADSPSQITPSHRIIGKPHDEEDAFSMLQQLQNREHLVVTGYSIVCHQLSYRHSSFNKSLVRFRPLSEKEIRAYIATGEPMDKAGAYGAQGVGRMFVASINGSYTNVMGLPLAEVVQVLQSLELWTPERLAGNES